jgi:hypothetical protein
MALDKHSAVAARYCLPGLLLAFWECLSLVSTFATTRVAFLGSAQSLDLRSAPGLVGDLQGPVGCLRKYALGLFACSPSACSLSVGASGSCTGHGH